MPKFNPISRKPGELIRSEDWNKIQEDIRGDLEELEKKLAMMKDYVDNMEESTTLINMDSIVGKAYKLDEPIPSESKDYETPIIGLLTKQYLIPKGETGEICKFSIVSQLTSIDYWSGAENGNKKTLDVTFNYIDGTNAVISGLLIHDRNKLRPKGADNPYIEYLLAPNELVWYRYRVQNPNPTKEVLSVSFQNSLQGCTARIGNCVHCKSKITQGNV